MEGKKSSAAIVSIWDIVYLVLAAISGWQLYQHEPMSTVVTALNWVVVGIVPFWLWSKIVSPKRAAKKMLGLGKSLYSTDHEYREIQVGSEFPSANLEYYDSMRRRFEKLGFRLLGDVENVTLTAALPSMRAFIRVMASQDRTTTTGIAYVKAKGWIRLLQMIGLLPKKLRTLDLETEFSDGVFVATSLHTRLTLPEFPRIESEKLPWGMDDGENVRVLAERHSMRVREYLAAHEGIGVRTVATLVESIAMQKRQQRIKNAHKSQIGYLTREDLTRSSPDTPTANELVGNALDEIKRTEGGRG